MGMIHKLYDIDQVETTSIRIIAEKTGLEEYEILKDATFTDDLGIDSLDQFEILVEFENVFSVFIPEEDSEKLKTVGSLIQYIKNKKYGEGNDIDDDATGNAHSLAVK